MPPRKQIKWAQLRVGIMVATALVILAVGIILISGSIGIFTRKYTLKAYFPNAGGLRPGDQVQLAGIPAGSVKTIRVSPFTDPNRAVEIDMRVARRFQNQIRADSQADQATAGLLGEAYLDISRGSPNQPVLRNGATVTSRQEKNLKQVVQNADDVISNLRVLSAKLNEITTQITSGQGSIGKLIYDNTLYDRLNRITLTADRIVNGVAQGQGTLGKLLVDPSVYQKTEATLTRLNQVLDQVQSGKGTVGRLMSDPAVYNQLKDVATKANALVDSIHRGQGTLGKLVADPSLYNRVDEAVGHLNNVVARMDNGKGSLGLLSTNSKLYENLSASADSLRQFLTEFRQNPRKYLTVHMKLF